jgi:oxygen-dependent protoporphyrinogen oxidase
VDALVGAVGAGRVRLATPVAAVEPEGGRFVVRTADGAERSADAVVVATAAPAAAELVGAVAPSAAGGLAAIAHVSIGQVLLVCPAATADALPDAAGFVVPSGRAPMLSATFVSRMWPDPAFGDRAVVRCIVGGAGAEDVLDAPDDDIVQAVCRHLAAVLPLPDVAEASRVVRRRVSVPQYEVGHLDRVEAIRGALPPGIVLAGDAYVGVGMADVIRSANEAAAQVLAHLEGMPVGTEQA